jgi:hypothetical protein
MAASSGHFLPSFLRAFSPNLAFVGMGDTLLTRVFDSHDTRLQAGFFESQVDSLEGKDWRAFWINEMGL